MYNWCITRTRECIAILIADLRSACQRTHMYEVSDNRFSTFIRGLGESVNLNYLPFAMYVLFVIFFVIKLKSSFKTTITYRFIVTVNCHILCYFVSALSVKLALYKFNTLTIYPWTGPFVNLKVVSVLCQFSLLSCAKFFD